MTAHGKGQQKFKGTAESVGQGQKRDDGVSDLERKVFHTISNIGRQAFMGEDHPFGQAGGARGIDQGGRVTAVDRPRGLVPVSSGRPFGVGAIKVHFQEGIIQSRHQAEISQGKNTPNALYIRQVYLF